MIISGRLHLFVRSCYFVCECFCIYFFIWRKAIFSSTIWNKHLPVKVFLLSLCSMHSALWCNLTLRLLFLSALLSPAVSACPIISLFIVQCLPNNWNLIKYGRLMCLNTAFWHLIIQSSAINPWRQEACCNSENMVLCRDFLSRPHLLSHCIFYKEESVQLWDSKLE